MQAASAAHWYAAPETRLPLTDEWLAPAEARIATGLRTTKRRTEYLLRRWVGKHAVAADAGLTTDLPSLARIEVANRSGGAPYVMVDGAPLGRSVSLSDRAGWAICVLGVGSAPLGCDIELVEPRSPAFVADFLTGPEQDAVAARPSGERDVVANLVWSAKESALKALQTGLDRDTRTVDVHLASGDGAGWAALRVDVGAGTSLPGWWRRDGEFVVTVVTGGPSAPPVPLTGSDDLSSAVPTHSWLDRPSGG